MKDGYYLSTYLHIDPLSRAIGWTHRHDQNMSLWRKSGDKLELTCYWELERVTGQKQHYSSFRSVGEAEDFINRLLAKFKLTIKDLVAVFGTPGLDTISDYHSLDEYEDCTYHSVCHLFSSLMSDTEKFYNEPILALALDGGPDRVVDHHRIFEKEYLAAVVRHGKPHIVPIKSSPGRLWFLARERFSLREGSLMALQTASTSECFQRVEKDLFDGEDDYFQAAERYLRQTYNAIEQFSERDAGVLFNGFDKRFSERENRISMCIKILHQVSVLMVEKIIDDLCAKFDLSPRSTYLSLSGGYALNCHTNSRLLQKYGFKGLIAPPCVNDSGISLGAALYYFYRHADKPAFALGHASHGESDSLDDGVLAAQFKDYIASVSPLNEEQIVADLIAGPIGWFDEKAEIGPRALGCRSLLADPRNASFKNRLNEIKQREWWRPVAPIILEEHLDAWFEQGQPSPYMLHTFVIKEDKLAHVPVITHLDKTARVQTIHATAGNRLRLAIEAFHRVTGVPIVANTSMNDKGEPIVNTISEALNFALRKRLDIVYVNGMRLQLKNHDEYRCGAPLRRPYAEFTAAGEEDQAYLKRENPYEVPLRHLAAYCRLPVLRERYDLKKQEDVHALLRIANELENRRKVDHGTTAHTQYLKILRDVMV